MAHGFSATVFSIQHMLISPSCIVRKLVGMSKIGPIWREQLFYVDCSVNFSISSEKFGEKSYRPIFTPFSAEEKDGRGGIDRA